MMRTVGESTPLHHLDILEFDQWPLSLSDQLQGSATDAATSIGMFLWLEQGSATLCSADICMGP